MSFHENNQIVNTSYQYLSSINSRKNNYSVSPGSIKYKKIGNYILLSTIGSGTFSVVKLGIHLPTQQKVAIKILDKNRINDENDIKRISREIHILSKLSHPNIAQLYETIPSEKHIYIIMEFIEGHDLFQYIYSLTRLTELKASKLFRQLISCLEYIHTLGIVHRDIKPENILLNKKKTSIKLVDFGLSNSYKHGSLLKTACGSPCYASPEMISGKEYDPLYSDLWSCGVVLYCMLVGKLPFDDEDIKLLYYNIRYANYFMPPFLSNIAQDFLRKILTPNPNRRIRLEELKKHPFFLIGERTPLLKGILVGIEDIPINIEIVKKIKNVYFKDNNKIDENYIISNLKQNHHNNITAIYYLMIKKIEDNNDVINKTKNIIQKNSKNENNNNTNTNYDNISNGNNKIDSKTNNKNKINNSLNNSINEASKQEGNIFNVNNIKRITFNSNDISLKSNKTQQKIQKNKKKVEDNSKLDKRFNVVVINNIVTDSPNNKIINSKDNNINHNNSHMAFSKKNNNSNNKMNYSNNFINSNNQNIYSNNTTNNITNNSNIRTRSDNNRVKNKNLITTKNIIYNKKCISKKEKNSFNITSKSQSKKKNTLIKKNNIRFNYRNKIYKNNSINQNNDNISNDNTIEINSITSNKIKAKKKIKDINLKRINFKFKDINYIEVNTKTNNNINKVEIKKPYSKNKQKYNKIISRNEKLIYNNYNNTNSKGDETSYLTQSKIKNIIINENFFGHNNFNSNKLLINDFNKTFTDKNKINLVKTDDSILQNKNAYNSLNINYINNYKNNLDTSESNSPNININCNNNVNIYINKNNKIKDKKYNSCNNKNNRNKICFNNENIENGGCNEKFNNLLGFNLNNMIIKGRTYHNSNSKNRNNTTVIKNNSLIKDKNELFHSKSKQKQYKISITLQNDNYKNKINELDNHSVEENKFQINNNNEIQNNKNKFLNSETIGNQNNNLNKISLDSPINFNSPKIYNNINKITNNSNINKTGISVNFSNITKKKLSKEKIQKNIKNKEVNNLNNLNIMNDCLNRIINNNYNLKNNMRNNVCLESKKIYNNTYYSTGKKIVYDNKTKNVKCLSFNKNKEIN